MGRERGAEIRARVDAATPGPWYGEKHEEHHLNGSRKVASILSKGVPNSLYPGLPSSILKHDSWYVFPEMADLEFIAASREDVPYLLDRLAQAEAALRIAHYWMSPGDPDEAVDYEADLATVLAALAAAPSSPAAEQQPRCEAVLRCESEKVQCDRPATEGAYCQQHVQPAAPGAGEGAVEG